MRALKARAKEKGANFVEPIIATAIEHQGNDIQADIVVHPMQANEKQLITVIAPGERHIMVRLLPGLPNGCRLRLRGLGTGRNGDLYLRVWFVTASGEIQKDLSESEAVVEIPISEDEHGVKFLPLAIRIETIGGIFTKLIPKGTQLPY